MWHSYSFFLRLVLNSECQRTVVMFTFSLFWHGLVGVSGLDEIGVNSTDADSADVARLLMPLDSLPVLGEVRPESDKFLKFCSHSILRSFMFSVEKCSGSRPNNGSANVNAILLCVVLLGVSLSESFNRNIDCHNNIIIKTDIYENEIELVKATSVLHFFAHVSTLHISRLNCLK